MIFFLALASVWRIKKRFCEERKRTHVKSAFCELVNRIFRAPGPQILYFSPANLSLRHTNIYNPRCGLDIKNEFFLGKNSVWQKHTEQQWQKPRTWEL
jgi:hypothetical protein